MLFILFIFFRFTHIHTHKANHLQTCQTQTLFQLKFRFLHVHNQTAARLYRSIFVALFHCMRVLILIRFFGCLIRKFFHEKDWRQATKDDFLGTLEIKYMRRLRFGDVYVRYFLCELKTKKLTSTRFKLRV